MKQVIFNQTGLPKDVLFIEEAPMPIRKSHEVLVKVLARNINPSDIMFVQGLYGITPQLPSSAGFEAVGIVEESDDAGVLAVGTRVIFTTVGTWKEYICLPAKGVIPVPAGMSDEIACQAFVNPFTAYGMLETSGLQAGDHLLITAGASAWGKLVVQMAAKKGILVACTVRREEQKAVLKSLGADVVVNVQEENLGKVLKSWAPEGVKAVFDAVGGDQGAKAMNCLSIGSTMYVFGLLSLQPIPLHSGVMIFKNLKIEGWWLSSWWEKLGSDGIQKAMKAVFGYLLSQEVTVDIQAKYPLEQFKEAIEAYEKEGRTGKILIC